jgi:hypothetical protein
VRGAASKPGRVLTTPQQPVHALGQPCTVLNSPCAPGVLDDPVRVCAARSTAHIVTLQGHNCEVNERVSMVNTVNNTVITEWAHTLSTRLLCSPTIVMA